MLLAEWIYEDLASSSLPSVSPVMKSGKDKTWMLGKEKELCMCKYILPFLQANILPLHIRLKFLNEIFFY